MNIGEKELESLCIGSEITGSGGGGSTYPVKMVLKYYLENGKNPTFMKLKDVPDSSLVLAVAYIGSPMIMDERLPQGNNLLSSIKTLENSIGQKTSAIIPLESGGVNSLIPLIAGINSSTPVIDADGMGRAFPEISMTTFSFNGVSVAPLTVSDDYGNVVVAEELNENLSDELARGIGLIFGGGAWLTAYPMTGGEVKKFAIEGTVSRNIEIGDVFSLPIQAEDKIKKLRSRFRARLIGEGYVREIFRYREGKFAKGDLYIEFEDGRFIKISFQNEYMLIRENKKVIASVPEIISLLDTHTLQPIDTENVSADDEVTVLTIPPPSELMTPKALKKIGPQAFGYEI
ncbi:MAG: DUF917 domain-containing protein [Thermoplasmatales archaeon]|jgi:DUF917 family protein|nr:DUF917 domain-containing protein [Candidatus Thermoplasmatota archaeon]MDA8055384.1 DUF917 domain-containing protein [Thermoplasmatales archaeon]